MDFRNLDTIFEAIRQRKTEAEAKYGANPRYLHDETWLRVIVEEVGECANEITLDDIQDEQRLDDEIIDMIQTGVAWLQDRAYRRPPGLPVGPLTAPEVVKVFVDEVADRAAQERLLNRKAFLEQVLPLPPEETDGPTEAVVTVEDGTVYYLDPSAVEFRYD